MSRRHRAVRRVVLPDVRYGNEDITRVLNVLMKGGNKSVVERHFYKAMDLIEKKLNENPVEVFNTAIENLQPVLEVRTRRVGGATYQVPTEVRPVRRKALSIKWLVECARARKERSLSLRLVGEICDAYKKQGAAIKKRENVHKMAEANKAFSHFRW